jgi:raffinose/stachyose/melibiose transport system substrate-binding protein
MKQGLLRTSAAALVIAAGLFGAGSALAQAEVSQWDQFSDTGMTAAGPAMEQLRQVCEKEVGNAKIVRTVAPSIGIRETYRVAMAAGNAPVLAYTWPAASVLASYARTDKLAEFDKYAEQYKWDWIDPFYKGRNSYKGHLYGIPMEQDLMGVYYNKALFAENGVEVPKTYDEFKAAVEKFKTAGIIPIAFGNRDGWPATNTMSLILGASVGRAAEEKVLFGDEPWTNEGFAKAAATFAEWAKNGYFPDGFNGIGYDEANALFNSGRAAMTITGTWVLQDIGRNAKFDLGVFMLPPIEAGVAAGTMWGEGSQWQISASASQEQKDAAAAYINCLTGADKRQVWVEKGYLVPIGTTAEDLQKWETLPIVKDFYTLGLSTSADNFYDLHTTLPESVVQVLYPELQRMLGGESEPKEFLEKMQAAWQAAGDKNERWVP